MSKLGSFLELVVLFAIVGAITYFTVISMHREFLADINNASHGGMDRSRILQPNMVKEVAVCVFDMQAENNTGYYHVPLIGTRLICDGPESVGSNQGKNMLAGLYADGWSVIEMIDPSVEINMSGIQRRVSPVIFLERQVIPPKNNGVQK